MTDEPRKSKRPKAIQAKSRVTTEATKAKLPRPTRKKPANVRLRPDAPTPEKVQCPRCEKWVRPGPHDIHTCYDAKALREELATPSPIAGQPLPKTPTADAPDFRAIPCGEDVTMTGANATYQHINVIGLSFDGVDGRTYTIQERGIGVKWTPPDTSAYPWPLKWAWKLDGWLAKLARWFA